MTNLVSFSQHCTPVTPSLNMLSECCRHGSVAEAMANMYETLDAFPYPALQNSNIFMTSGLYYNFLHGFLFTEQ